MELMNEHNTTIDLFNTLVARVGEEEQLKQMIYCFADQEADIELIEEKSEEKLLFDRISEVNTQLKYLEYTINKLERKQIAESISRITKFEKSKGETKFYITFE